MPESQGIWAQSWLICEGLGDFVTSPRLSSVIHDVGLLTAAHGAGMRQTSPTSVAVPSPPALVPSSAISASGRRQYPPHIPHSHRPQ